MTAEDIRMLGAAVVGVLLFAWLLSKCRFTIVVAKRPEHDFAEPGISEALREVYKLPVIRTKAEEGRHGEAISD